MNTEPTQQKCPCDVCGLTAGTDLFRATDHREGLGGGFGVVQCTGCGLVRTEPRPADLTQWYPAEYANHSTQPPLTVRLIGRALGYNLKPARRSLVAALLGWALPNADVGSPLGTGVRILDVGAGNGSAVHAMTSAGADAWGVEPSENGVAAAHARGISTVVHGTLEEASLPPGPWDLIRFTHVLEHVSSPVATLRYAREMLSPGGRIVILVPNFGGFGRRAFGRAWDGLEVPRHLHHFTRTTLRRTLSAAGLTPQTIRTVALFGVLPSSIDARTSGGNRQRGWGRSFVVRVALYPLELALSCLRLGDGIMTVAYPTGSDR